jgi:hypothetical protein
MCLVAMKELFMQNDAINIVVITHSNFITLNQ